MNITPKEWLNSTLEVSSAWKGLEEYMLPLINALNIKTNLALEFGVDLGYSSYVFSKIFDKVIGVDSFEGDCHIGHNQGDEFYNNVCNTFNGTNVSLVRSRFEEFIQEPSNNIYYDLIHIDIVHLYEPTYKCTEWAVDHSNVVILHDTCSFPEIDRVCQDIAKNKNRKYYNIPNCNGLGVLYK